MKRVRFLLGSLVCLAALWLAVPALLLAQGELSLEGLSTRLQALVKRVDTLTARLDSIEALWVNSEPAILLDGSCVVGSEGGVQDATVLSFKETFDEWPNTDNFKVVGVSYNTETGVIGLQYEEWVSDQSTVEFWQGCEFIENTDWWERSYDAGPFDGYTVQTE